MARPVTVTAQGNAQVDTAQSKFGGASLLLDGSGDFLEIGSDFNAAVSFAGELTFECWFYQSATNSALRTLVSNWESGFLWAVSGGNSLVFYANGGLLGFSATSLTINANTWYHAAITRDPSNDMRIFLDGSQVGDTVNYTQTLNAQDTTAWGVNINNYPTNNPNSYFAGNLDEARISNVARYTSAFTPDTQAFTNDADTLLLLHMDGTDGSTLFLDDNSAASPGEVKEFSASQSVSSTVSSIVQRSRAGSASLSVSSTVSSIVQRSRDTGANFDVTATQTAASGRLRTGNATINGAFSPSITVNATRTVETQLAAEFNTSISANAKFDSESLLEFFANLNAQNDRRRDFDSTFSITSNFNTATSVFRDADAVFVSRADLDANVSNTADTNITVDGFATVDASVQRLRSTSVDLTSTFTVLAGAIELSELTLSADFTLDAQTLVIAGVVANLNTQSNLTAISSRRVSTSANPTVTTSVNALAGIQVSAQAALNSSFDLTARGRILVVDNIVFVIPNESREFTIAYENR